MRPSIRDAIAEPMAFLPVETIIRDQQNTHYQALRQADDAGDSTPYYRLHT
ncbi:hypothetical protein [Endozoicomonas sp. ALD040]|uniref:hypothetical protein n=1 Tax=unclassified Endozoicomonas TaxID=2644528 RepID=UPI003BAFB8A1